MKSKKGIIISVVVVIVYSIFTLVPFLWLFITSIKPEARVYEMPIRIIPDQVTLQNYIDVMSITSISTNSISTRIGPALLNTVIIAISSTFLSLIIGMPAAYSFARYQYRGSKQVFISIIIARMFPVITLAIPLFQLFRFISLSDTKLGMIIAYTALSLPFTIWVMYAFFKDFLPEIEEAAKIDGCNFINMFLKVVLPISAPGVASTFILTFIYPWNDLLLNTVLSSSIRSQNISSALLQFNTTYQIFWGHLAAGAIIASAPVILLTLLLQRYIVQGLTIGAVKG